jgi:hypothetical protein
MLIPYKLPNINNEDTRNSLLFSMLTKGLNATKTKRIGNVEVLWFNANLPSIPTCRTCQNLPNYEEPEKFLQTDTFLK